MHGPDGIDYLNLVEFCEVNPPARLAYVHRGEGETAHILFHASVDFVELETGTRVTLTSRFDSLAARDHVVVTYGAVEGGCETLGRIAQYLES